LNKDDELSVVMAAALTDSQLQNGILMAGNRADKRSAFLPSVL